MATKTEKMDQPESFETLLNNLETAVAKLEQEDLPLDEAISQYKAAMELVAACRTRLDEAEQTVNLLVQDKNGDWQTESLPEREENSNE